MDSKKAFFMQRLNDHIQYLDKVTKTIKGLMDSDGKQEINAYATGANHLFDTLVTQHEQFHVISSSVLEKHQQGDKDSAYKAMTEMHKLSGQLVSILLEIDRQSKLVKQ